MSDHEAPQMPQSPPVSTVSAVSAVLTEAPIVAHVVRGGFIESVHRGSAVVTDPQGKVTFEIGDSAGPMFPRSSSKPLQALAMVRNGLATNGPLLALACSSHSGEDFHLEAAREILARAGLSEADLQNTPDYPYDEAARIAWIAGGNPKQSVAQNCSGKHSSMLATCVANGWDPSTYREFDHPLQVAITDTIRDLTGSDPVAISVDGCGAPIHAVPLVGLARSFGRLAAATDGPEATVAGAMRRHPEFVGGTRRDVTALMRGIEGSVAKDGAEAAYAVGLPDGTGIAVKVADGSTRAAPVLLAAVLRRLGVDSEVALTALEYHPVLGHGEPVGSVVAVGL